MSRLFFLFSLKRSRVSAWRNGKFCLKLQKFRDVNLSQVECQYCKRFCDYNYDKKTCIRCEKIITVGPLRPIVDGGSGLTYTLPADLYCINELTGMMI
jgi:hypothetical protein